jgi:hypothetical protein
MDSVWIVVDTRPAAHVCSKAFATKEAAVAWIAREREARPAYTKSYEAWEFPVVTLAEDAPTTSFVR